MPAWLLKSTKKELKDNHTVGRLPLRCEVGRDLAAGLKGFAFRFQLVRVHPILNFTFAFPQDDSTQKVWAPAGNFHVNCAVN